MKNFVEPNLFSRLKTGLIILSITLLPVSNQVQANPQSPTVVAGTANFQNINPNTLHINTSDRAIINWQKFSIDQGELTRFNQPSHASAVLNRVISSHPSEIYGTLESNGKVFLINQNGILVGESGVINTANFVASTLEISNEDFLAQKAFLFQGDSHAKIINHGTIQTPDGDVSLIGYGIENTGSILAPNGEVSIAVGNEVILNPHDDQRILIKPRLFEGDREGCGIDNAGRIEALKVALQADGNPYAQAINHRGHIDALRVENVNGRVMLKSEKGVTNVSGSINAPGGEVQVLGEYVQLTESPYINVSDDYHPGNIYVGGGRQGKNPEIMNAKRTWVSPGTVMESNAVVEGDGGTIIVWSDEATWYYGNSSARGGMEGGNGGFGEVSGKSLTYAGHFNSSAQNPEGKTGTLLLDPGDIYVSTAFIGLVNMTADPGPPTTTYTVDSNPPGEGGINPSVIENELLLNNVVLDAVNNTGASIPAPLNGTITVQDNITWATANSLTFEANNAVIIEDNVQISGPAAPFVATSATSGDFIMGDDTSITVDNFTIAGFRDMIMGVNAELLAVDTPAVIDIDRDVILNENASITANASTLFVSADRDIILGENASLNGGSVFINFSPINPGRDVILGDNARITAITGSVLNGSENTRDLILGTNASIGAILGVNFSVRRDIILGQNAGINGVGADVILTADESITTCSNARIIADTTNVELTAGEDIIIGPSSIVMANEDITFDAERNIIICSNATITATEGDIIMTAVDNITTCNNVEISTVTSGLISLQTDNEDIVIGPSTEVIAVGNVTLDAGRDVLLCNNALVTSTAGTTMTITAGDDVKLNPEASLFLQTGSTLTVTATGDANDPGTISLCEEANIRGPQADITLNAGIIELGPRAFINTQGFFDDVSLTADSGDIVLCDSASIIAGNGNIILDAERDVYLGDSAELLSTLAISVEAGRDVILCQSSQIESSDQGVTIDSGLSGAFTGDISMGQDARVRALLDIEVNSESEITMCQRARIISLNEGITMDAGDNIYLGQDAGLNAFLDLTVDAGDSITLDDDSGFNSLAGDMFITATEDITLNNRAAFFVNGGLLEVTAGEDITLGPNSFFQAFETTVVEATAGSIRLEEEAAIFGRLGISTTAENDIILGTDANYISALGTINAVTTDGNITLGERAFFDSSLGMFITSGENINLCEEASFIASDLTATAEDNIYLGPRANFTIEGGATVTAINGNITLDEGAFIEATQNSTITAELDIKLGEDAQIRTTGSGNLEVTSESANIILDDRASLLANQNLTTVSGISTILKDDAFFQSNNGFVDVLAEEGDILLGNRAFINAETDIDVATEGKLRLGCDAFFLTDTGDIDILAEDIFLGDRAFIQAQSDLNIVSGDVTLSKDAYLRAVTGTVEAIIDGSLVLEERARILASELVEIVADHEIALGEDAEIRSFNNDVRLFANHDITLEDRAEVRAGTSARVESFFGEISLGDRAVVRAVDNVFVLARGPVTLGREAELRAEEWNVVVRSEEDNVVLGNRADIRAGNNIDIFAGISLLMGYENHLCARNGNILAIANANIISEGQTHICAGNDVTLVVDNFYPNPPFIGPGFISLPFSCVSSGVVNPGGALRIFTARQELNNFEGTFLNCERFKPGELFDNSATERWGVYFPSNFGGDPFTIFYKDNAPKINLKDYNLFIAATTEAFQNWRRFDEFIIADDFVTNDCCGYCYARSECGFFTVPFLVENDPSSIDPACEISAEGTDKCYPMLHRSYFRIGSYGPIYWNKQKLWCCPKNNLASM